MLLTKKVEHHFTMDAQQAVWTVCNSFFPKELTFKRKTNKVLVFKTSVEELQV